MGAAAEMEVSHLLALHGKCRDTDPDVAVPKTTGVLREKPPRNVPTAAAVPAGKCVAFTLQLLFLLYPIPIKKEDPTAAPPKKKNRPVCGRT